jgi:DNA-binding PadR family transcriptional regulator
MSKQQKTQFALLGLLSWKPMSGYDIKKIIDIGLSHFWSENYGQIYPTLNKLVVNGCAVKTEQSTSGKRKRNLYTITETGASVFREWLRQPSEPLQQRNELQLKFFLSSKLPSDISLNIIQEYKAQQIVIQEDYLASEFELQNALETGEYPQDVLDIFAKQSTKQTTEEQRRQCQVFYLSLRHGVLAVEARIAWCEEVEQILLQEKKNG